MSDHPIGTRFGKWTITGPSISGAETWGDKSGRNYPCRCDCGHTRWVQAHYLNHGKSTQCEHCQRRESLAKARKASHNRTTSGVVLRGRHLTRKEVAKEIGRGYDHVSKLIAEGVDFTKLVAQSRVRKHAGFTDEEFRSYVKRERARLAKETA